MYKRNQVFAAACAGLFLFGMTLITLGSILPALKIKYEADGLDAGLLASILPAGILTGSLVFGPIVDRYGYKLLLILSVMVSAISLEGLAFTESLSFLYVCIFFIGFGGGVINGGTSALVADISSQNKGANLSLLGVFFGIGALGLPLLLGVLSKHFAYTTILAAVGVFMILPVIYFMLVIFPIPKQAKGFPLKEGIKLLKDPALLLAGFFLFFESGIENLINNWTTSYLQEKVNSSNQNALYALTFSLLGLTIARLLLGALLKRISAFVIQMVSLLLVTAGCFILLSTHSYPVALTGLIVAGIGFAAGFPVILGYVGQLYTNLSGTAFSIALVIGLTGNILLNYFFGFIADKYGIRHLPLLIIGCIIFMILILIALKQRVRGKIKL